ncbi:MAG: glycoside hydrolase family 30 beta sandwich domain-containing protein [Bacteroidales bacterium]|nr:glycoside hydrolase family 30 beta sandwich domain-containing protein [Bacteroidales bacterium]
MKKKVFYISLLIICAIAMLCCNSKDKLFVTEKIYVTSESGHKIAVKENVGFVKGKPEGTVIKIDPGIIRQTMDGIGSSFTESSAFVLAHLDPEKRKEVMKKAFGEDGANFSLTRTHIGACDFCVEGKYSYLDKVGDVDLSSFSLDPDREGFSSAKYPGVVDENYDLLPMIKEALEIKNMQSDKELRIVASAWTAPYWMKDIEDWYIKGTPENNFQGTGGSLKEEYEETYADYLIKYLDTYRSEGINIWGITPVNEPHGNNGQWESMHFTPETQNEFIKKYLGPKLNSGENTDVKLLIYDQNRDGLEKWANVILGDEETSEFVYGAAVHWYESTFKVYEEVFDSVKARFPDHQIVHTEGCIDDLGKPAPDGITNPERFQEENWFMNDSFWWNDNATDWAYTATWEGVKSEDHPIYTPVHRYARNIIVSIDHWLSGWIDWNIVLDKNGGPNHVGNYCGAPIMIDTQSKEVYYTPLYYVLAQFSKTIRPGDKAVQTQRTLVGQGDDDLHACATINDDNLLSVQLLNTTKKEIVWNLQIHGQYAEIIIDPNSVQTVQVQL